MQDWAGVFIPLVLFILLSPGLLFQLPARTRVVELGNMATSVVAILVHSAILFCILIFVVHIMDVHVYVVYLPHSPSS